MDVGVAYPLPICEHVVHAEGEMVSVPHLQEVQCDETGIR